VKENTILREEVTTITAEMKKKDDTIKQLSDQLNRCDQENRSKSLRIIVVYLSTLTPHLMKSRRSSSKTSSSP
jgi:hypothetical protein